MKTIEVSTQSDVEERLALDTPTTELDRVCRVNSIKNAVAITEMEGGQPSAYCREQLGLFEAGRISATEMRDRVVSYAGR